MLSNMASAHDEELFLRENFTLTKPNRLGQEPNPDYAIWCWQGLQKTESNRLALSGHHKTLVGIYIYVY